MSLGRRGRLRLGLRLRLGPRLRLGVRLGLRVLLIFCHSFQSIYQTFSTPRLCCRVLFVSRFFRRRRRRVLNRRFLRGRRILVFYAVSFIYERTNERTKNFATKKKKKQKKKKSFVLSIVFVLRAHTRTRPRTNTTPRPRVSRRRRRRRRRRHGRGRATIKFVVDAFFDACAFQSPRVDDTRGGGETQNVFSF